MGWLAVCGLPHLFRSTLLIEYTYSDMDVHGSAQNVLLNKLLSDGRSYLRWS